MTNLTLQVLQIVAGKRVIKCLALLQIIGAMLASLVLPVWPINVIADSASAHGSKSTPYLMGVFPHLPPRELEKVYAPMAEQFSHVIGRPVQVGSSSSYEKFMENLDNQKYDIVFVQPFDYVRIADSLGYRPVATRDEPLSTIFVTGKKSPIKTLEDLRGKRLAMPPSVAAVSLLTMRYLEKQNLIVGKDIVLSHHRSHVSCLQQVLIGAADACATARPALRFFKHKMNTDMDIIAETQSIPHTLFATHPRVSMQEHNDIMSVILSWPNSKEGRNILERGKLKPFVEIKDSDYDVVRELEKKIK